jgi:hypothetical protein
VKVSCSEHSVDIIKRLLEKGLIAVCPYSIGFVDACLLGGDYMLLVNYFGDRLGEEVLRWLEEKEYYEDCILLKDSLEEYRDNLSFTDDYVF